MKNLLFLALVCSVFAISCGDSCSQDDWVGSFTGTTTCTGEDPEEGTTAITAGAADNEIVIDGLTIEVDGCSAEGTTTEDGIAVSYDLELSGDNITGTISATIFGIESTCTVDLSK